MNLLLLMFPLLAMLAIAAVVDLRRRRIPNWLTALIAVSGLVQAIAWNHSVVNWWQSFAGCAVGLLINLPLFMLHIRGGGDVKLFAAVGAWLGPTHIIAVFVIASLVAMVVAIAQAIVTRRVREVAHNTASIAVGLAHGEARLDPTDENFARRHVPYAVPVLIAVSAMVGLS